MLLGRYAKGEASGAVTTCGIELATLSLAVEGGKIGSAAGAATVESNRPGPRRMTWPDGPLTR